MKSLLAATLTLFLLAATPAKALVGGPWDNNTYSGEFQSAGTYQGSFRGHNTIGSHLFSMNPAAESFGRAIIYSHGVVYRGFMQGMVDLESNTVFGIVDALGIIAGPETTGRAAAFTASGSFDADVVSRGAITRYEGWAEFTFTGIRIITGTVDISTRNRNNQSSTTVTEAVDPDTSDDVQTNISQTDTDLDFERRTFQDFSDGIRVIKCAVTGMRTSFNAPTFVSNNVVGGAVPTPLNANADSDDGGGTILLLN